MWGVNIWLAFNSRVAAFVMTNGDNDNNWLLKECGCYPLSASSLVYLSDSWYLKVNFLIRDFFCEISLEIRSDIYSS